MGEELERLKSEHEAVLDELLLRGKCEAASARATAEALRGELDAPIVPIVHHFLIDERRQRNR